MDLKTFQEMQKDKDDLSFMSPEEREDGMEMIMNYKRAGHDMCKPMDHVFDSLMALLVEEAGGTQEQLVGNFSVIKGIFDIGLGIGIEIGKEMKGDNKQKAS